MSEASYRVIEDYPRRQHFELFRHYASPFYAVTFELDAALVKRLADERGWSFYTNLCYFFTRAMQDLEPFRYRLLDGRIVLYDHLDVGLTVPAPGALFSFAHVDYHPGCASFNRRAEEILRHAGQTVTLDRSPHLGYVYYSALPKIPFTSLTHAWREPTEAQPRVTFGKFRREGERLAIPVNVQVSHVFVDGVPLGELAERAQETFNRAPEIAGEP